MKIVRFVWKNGPQYGLIEKNEVYAIMGDIFGDFERGERVGPLSEIQLLAPCTPTKIVAVGRNYAEHASEMQSDVPTEPLIFLKPPSAVVGPGEVIVYPPISQRVDHEAELAAVIGRRARDVPASEALNYVLGYTCANDITARDLQCKDGQWTRSKSFDTFCPLGPWLAVGLDANDLTIECRVNGAVKQKSRTSRMIFPITELICYITQVMTLEPGDVILTGTPAGVGSLQPGDRVEVEIEGIGVLENTVAYRHHNE
ncbi:MAG: fumarylacetoacetate hydrolase family protein [Anaerolineae bacterium]|jgi:2-keto-4-pentenoate hydratase/2-oxohepta-3-ene-1,7-dioic acid hydratase in catechol pathway|nr:fumarylacetoacetate hydrolase family protein [Anaerolineae bacterium]MDH7474914.1 fumarylacetoacetate hydrolase family protein [Anaerolineae bacterium]